MEQQSEPLTWQLLLKRCIEIPAERDLLAEAVGVNSITLQRWASRVSRPRHENMLALLHAMKPERSADFLRLAITDFPNLLGKSQVTEPVALSLSSEFYASVLYALSLTPLPMYRQTVQRLILQQAVKQFDPHYQGISINLVCCMPPRVGRTRVRSLREVSGKGTWPWAHDLEQKTMFLGAESLVGHMLTQSRPLVINSRQEITFFPANWTQHECSVAAFPILWQARVAGGLLVSSALEGFFTAERVSLLEHYSYLAALIFKPEEFYQLSDIDLGMMPSEDAQIPYFRDFHQRISQKFADALLTENRITLQEARELVWQDLEDELLRIIPQNTD